MLSFASSFPFFIKKNILSCFLRICRISDLLALLVRAKIFNCNKVEIFFPFVY